MNPNIPDILVTDNLTIGYRMGHRPPSVIASGLNLSLPSASVTCLLGPNGAGKSTLLRTLCRRQMPLCGSVSVENHQLQSLSDRTLSRLIAIVYPEHTHAGALTAREVVELGRQPYTGFFGRLGAADRNIVDESLHAVGMAHLTERPIGRLSDGERQKVMIARALAQRTPVMILDEPTSFLDVASRLSTMELLHTLSRRFSTAILLATHDVGAALPFADRLWLMPDGAPMIQGTASELIASGAMDSLFPDSPVTFDRHALDFRLAATRGNI